MVTVFVENIVLKHKRVDICSPSFHTSFFNYLVKKYNLLYITIIYCPYIVITICTIKRLFRISFLFLYKRYLPSSKKSQRIVPKECLISISNTNSHWVCEKKKSCGTSKKFERKFKFSKISSMRSDALRLRLSEPTAWLAP